MGRPRKLLKNSTGDLTEQRRIRKEAEEAELRGMPRDLLEEMPSELRDKTARETWERILPDILREEITCNLDRDNVIMYCNAWSETMEAQRRLKRNKTDDDYQELWRRRLKDARAECRRYGRLIGMDPSSRLQRASTKVDAEDEKITAMFGGI